MNLTEYLQALTGRTWGIPSTGSCPMGRAHKNGDKSKSFSVHRSADGKVRFKCHTPGCPLHGGGDLADLQRAFGGRVDPRTFREETLDPLDAAKLDVRKAWGKRVRVERLDLEPIGEDTARAILKRGFGLESRRHWLLTARTEDPKVPIVAEWKSKSGPGKKLVFRCCATSRGPMSAMPSGLLVWDPEWKTWRKYSGEGSRSWRILEQGKQDAVYFFDHGTPAGQHSVLFLPEKREGYIFHVEGGKDARALSDIGLNASAVFNGAGAELTREQVEDHRGREVILLGDNDAAGDGRIVRVQRQMAAAGIVAARVPGRVLGVPQKGDVYDWIHGRGKESAKSTRAALRATLTHPGEDYPGLLEALEEGRRMTR